MKWQPIPGWKRYEHDGNGRVRNKHTKRLVRQREYGERTYFLHDNRGVLRSVRLGELLARRITGKPARNIMEVAVRLDNAKQRPCGRVYGLSTGDWNEL